MSRFCRNRTICEMLNSHFAKETSAKFKYREDSQELVLVLSEGEGETTPEFTAIQIVDELNFLGIRGRLSVVSSDFPSVVTISSHVLDNVNITQLNERMAKAETFKKTHGHYMPCHSLAATVATFIGEAVRGTLNWMQRKSLAPRPQG